MIRCALASALAAGAGALRSALDAESSCSALRAMLRSARDAMEAEPDAGDPVQLSDILNTASYVAAQAEALGKARRPLHAKRVAEIASNLRRGARKEFGGEDKLIADVRRIGEPALRSAEEALSLVCSVDETAINQHEARMSTVEEGDEDDETCTINESFITSLRAMPSKLLYATFLIRETLSRHIVTTIT